MHYVLYTPCASHWNEPRKFFPEFIYYRRARASTILNEVFAPSDAFHSLAFWLGADAENIR
jgi:hypothetical protein